MSTFLCPRCGSDLFTVTWEQSEDGSGRTDGFCTGCDYRLGGVYLTGGTLDLGVVTEDEARRLAREIGESGGG